MVGDEIISNILSPGSKSLKRFLTMIQANMLNNNQIYYYM